LNVYIVYFSDSLLENDNGIPYSIVYGSTVLLHIIPTPEYPGFYAEKL
jgi:hypothetical protein